MFDYENEKKENKRKSNLVCNMSDDRLAKKRKSGKKTNMSDERVIKQQESHQVANMSDDRVSKHKESNTIANMSEQKIMKKKHSDSKATFYIKLSDEVDWTKQCKCGKFWLKHTSKATRKKCCMGSKVLRNETYQVLEPYDGILLEKFEQRDAIFKKYCNVFNSEFALAASGVDNGMDIGQTLIFGDSSVTINGRYYHYFRKVGGNKGGSLQHVLCKGDEDNYDTLQKRLVKFKHPDMVELLNLFKDYLLQNNYLYKELSMLKDIEIESGNKNKMYSISTDNPINKFDISCITSNDLCGK